MTKPINISRLTLLLITLMLAIVLAFGFYASRLQSLLELQAAAFLKDYGVQKVHAGRWRLGAQQFSIASLILTGEQDGVSFRASLSSLELGFNWRQLIAGELQSVRLGVLDLSLQEKSLDGVADAAGTLSVTALLPWQFMAQFPAHSLNVEQWSLLYTTPNLAKLAASGSLKLADRLDVQFSGQHLDTHFSGSARSAPEVPIQIDLQFHDREIPLGELRAELHSGAEDTWQWSLQAKLAHAPLVHWLRRLNTETGWLSETSALYPLLLEGNSEVTATVEHPDLLDVEGPSPEQWLSQFRVKAHADNSITQLGLTGALDGVRGEIGLDLGLEAGEINLLIGPAELAGKLQTALLQLTPEQLRWLGWGDWIKLRWSNPGEISIATTAAANWLLHLRDNQLSLGNQDSELRLEALQLEATVNPSAPARSKLVLDTGIEARAHKHKLPRLLLAFKHPGFNEPGKFDLSLRDAAESLHLTTRGQLDINSGVGSVHSQLQSLDLPHATTTVLPLLKKFGLVELPQPLKVLAGKFSWSTELRSRGFSLEQLQQRSDLSIEALNGSYGGYRFSGVDLAAQWRGIEHWQTEQAVRFSMKKLFLGFELLDTQALIALPEPTPLARPVIRIDQFSTGVFGGRLSQSGQQHWDFGADSNSIRLQAQDWQLGHIVALQQNQDITAQGTLDGDLPATVADGRLIINKGFMRAREPGGTIRYVTNEASQALAASSPELKLALALLSDFRYQKLESRVDLDSAGNLLLGLSLSGKNPAQFSGKLVEFNINLEQNIDPLLQSLQLSGKLVEKLDKRLQ